MAEFSILPNRAAHILLPLYERHGRRLPGLASVLGVVLAAYAAAQLTWALIPLPAGAAWRPAPPPANAAASAARAGDAGELNALLAARLFGDYRAPALGAAQVANAPETHLDLTLIGILAGSRERESRALIANSNHEEAPYAVGDDVTRGVQLQAIFPDRVILSRSGQLETLRLDRDAGGAPPPPGAAAAEPADAAAGGDLSLAQVRDQVLKDPNKASEYIRVQPATIGGQLKGYRVYPGRNRNAFNSSGLRPGDLVTSVNGVELNDAGRALQLLGDLSQANQATVTVDRGGQTQTLNLSIN